MDNLIQTIETETLVPQEVDDFEQYLKHKRLNTSNIRDLAQIYAVALIYQEIVIIDVIDKYMNSVNNEWYLDGRIILETIYHSTCRKQNRELDNTHDGFVCQKFPPFSDLKSEQINILKNPYIQYLDRPYIRNYQIENPNIPLKKQTHAGCCNIL